VVNVYQIAMVATLLPLAALGEVVGHHRIYVGGLVLFTLASLVCACAWSLPSLLTARVLQGFGAGGIMSVNTVGSLRLSRALAGTGFRTQRDGRRDRLHARSDDRLGHPRDWTLELAVCHQHPLRCCCDPDRFEDIAAYPESDAWLRFSGGNDGVGLSRPFHPGDRKRRPSRAAWACIDRTCLRHAA